MNPGLILPLLLAVSVSAAQAQNEIVQPVPIANPGFEAGAEGWKLPANAAIVSDQAFSGKHSARLMVQDPVTDAVYITRQVPVVSGSRYVARCQVKTAGVMKKPGRMESVGAGLIVEWADRNGNWFAAGSYATGLYGDHDWTRCEAKDLRAPEQAGYAILFLALRGAGTAWFDDVALDQVQHILIPQAPQPGQSLHSNRPLLQWRDDPQAMRYTVELSRDPAFPAAATTAFETGQDSFRPPEPIPPGRWCWRVSAPGYAPTAPCSFEQTAPETADTTPPEMDLQPVRVVRKDQPARVSIHLNSAGKGLPAVHARLGDSPITVTLEPGEQGVVNALLSARWQPGLNRVTLTAADAAGNADTQELLVLFRPIPSHPISIAPDGAYLDSGQRIFPLGIYQVSPAAMPVVKKAGIQVVHSYEFESSQNDVAARAYLDAAAAAGLRVFIGFDRGVHSPDGLVRSGKRHVTERVAALCDNPGLFCWYLYDEPEIANQYVSPRGLIAYADLVRRLDPYHPVVVTTWGPRMALYRPSFDTHWTQAYTTPAGVVKQIAEHRSLLGPATPITLLLHCFDREQGDALKAGKPVDPERFEPDGAWMRAAAFAGITQRVNGLWWWWYADGVKGWVTVSSVPEAWQALTQVLAQIHELEPVLVDPAKPETGSLIAGGGQIDWWSKKIGRETTLIAVNTTEKTVQGSIPATGDGPAAVLFENRQVQRQAGKITDQFERYAVHVYEFDD